MASVATNHLLYLPSFPPSSSCSSPSIFKSSKCLVQLKVPAASQQKEIRFCAVSCASIMASLGSNKGGAAILERPTFDQSQFDPSTQVEEGGDIGRLRDRRGAGSGDSYRVLLIDDMRHSEKLVVKVLPQVVPSVMPDNARKLFHQSRENGVAVVIVTVKEHAEFYAQMMIRGGLRSSIEPDSSTA